MPCHWEERPARILKSEWYTSIGLIYINIFRLACVNLRRGLSSRAFFSVVADGISGLKLSRNPLHLCLIIRPHNFSNYVQITQIREVLNIPYATPKINDSHSNTILLLWPLSFLLNLRLRTFVREWFSKNTLFSQFSRLLPDEMSPFLERHISY